jgi:protein-tyrosine-phosphatase
VRLSFPNRLRPLARAIRRWPERRLHPLRRRRARRRLSEAAAPDSVLFICLGNICRSPFAAELARSAFQAQGLDAFSVSSAGFIGPDRPTPDFGLQAARAHGVDLSRHRSSLVRPETVREGAQWIVIMDSSHGKRLVRDFGAATEQLLHLGDLDPEPIQRRTIPDPFDQSPQVFEACYARISRCLDTFLEATRGWDRTPGSRDQA